MAITKGQWTTGVGDKNYIFGRDGLEIAVASFRYGESEDNARLIAAAPDLLAVLEAMIIDDELGLSVRSDMKLAAAAKAAIAKARGEEI